MSLLSLEGVSKRYGTVVALDRVDLTVPAGSRTAIVGASGSGKTTLLRVVAGFEAPDEGRISLGGATLAEGPSALPAHRRNIGLVAQEGALFPHLSIADNVGFGLDRRMPGRAGRIAELMEMVGLDRAMLTRCPDQLSGGQQQRVALARALARRPALMLLDEPFSALDTSLRASTRKAVADLLAAAGITTILVTHDQAEALSFADQLGVMRSGRLLQVGTPQELYLRPADAGIATFLGEAVLLPARLRDGWAECALGRIPVDAAAHHGEGQIMLRPEQLVLGAGPDACAATVAAAEFGGADSRLVLRLGDGTAVTLRRSCLDTPPAGSTVRLTVAGPAHVLQIAGSQPASASSPSR